MINRIGFQKRLTIDLDTFAQDFVGFIARREKRNPSRVSVLTVPDDRWDQLLAVTAPYRNDPENQDLRVGMAYAIRSQVTHEEVPDLVKVLFPALAEAMQTSDLIIALNLERLTHPKDFNFVFNNLVLLCEKALAVLGYANLNPIEDGSAFGNSDYFKAENYVIK
jgi:hypothetical protein